MHVQRLGFTSSPKAPALPGGLVLGQRPTQTDAHARVGGISTGGVQESGLMLWRGADTPLSVAFTGYREDHEHGTERTTGAGEAEHSQAGPRRGPGHAGAHEEPPDGRRQLGARQPPPHHPDPGPRRCHAAQQQLHHGDDDHLQAGAVGPAGRGSAAAPADAAGAAGGAAPLQQQQQLRGGQPRRHPHREALPQQLNG